MTRRRLGDLAPYAVPALVAIVLASVVGIGIFTNRALLSIEEQLPSTVLAQEHDIALVVQDLADLIRAIENARQTAEPRRFDAAFSRLEEALDRLRRIRGTYNFDNLVNASSMHAIANPALSDIERWLVEGIPGFFPASDEVLYLAQRRAEDAYAKVREQYRHSNAMARTVLSEQAARLNDFRREVRRLLFGAGGLAALIVLLTVYQRSTERRRRLAEAAQRESEARFRAVVEHAPFAVNLKAVDGRYILVNRKFAELAQTTVDDVVGKTIADLGTPELAKAICDADRHVLETLLPLEYEMERPGMPNGDRVFVAVKFPVLDGDGAATAVGSMWIDVTEHRRAEEKSRALQNELAHISRLNTLGEMAAGFAHELNQPLTAISNYAAGITRRLGSAGADEQTLAVVMERICEQARLASDVIRRIRRFIQKEEPEKRSTDINAAIRSAVDLLRGDAVRAEVSVRLDLDRGVPPVMADEIGLQQVVINLVRNAMEAMAEVNGRPRNVTIRTGLGVDGTVHVTVEDTGRGIEPAHRERLFEPFFTTKKEGLGVGLLICRSIIEDHGGTLDLSSVAGHGTAVTFRLSPWAGG